MRNLIIIIMLGLGAFAVSQYALPAWGDVSTLRATLARVNEAVSATKDIAAARDQALERYHSVTPDQKRRLDALLPQKLFPEELYVFFENFVPSTGIQFNDVSISAPTAGTAISGGGTQVIPFQLKATGTYAEVRSLLDGMENNVKLMDIVSVGISENQDHLFVIDVKANLYYGG